MQKRGKKTANSKKSKEGSGKRADGLKKPPHKATTSRSKGSIGAEKATGTAEKGKGGAEKVRVGAEKQKQVAKNGGTAVEIDGSNGSMKSGAVEVVAEVLPATPPRTTVVDSVEVVGLTNAVTSPFAAVQDDVAAVGGDATAEKEVGVQPVKEITEIYKEVTGEEIDADAEGEEIECMIGEKKTKDGMMWAVCELKKGDKVDIKLGAVKNEHPSKVKAYLEKYCKKPKKKRVWIFPIPTEPDISLGDNIIQILGHHGPDKTRECCRYDVHWDMGLTHSVTWEELTSKFQCKKKYIDTYFQSLHEDD